MSYDVSIGGEEFNYTYNVSKLFYDHIPECDATGGLNELDGKSGKQAFGILSDAFERIYNTRNGAWTREDVGEKNFCAMYDPPNGWGSTVGALIFLARIMAACAANPRKKVRVG